MGTDMSYRNRRLAQRLENPEFRAEYERSLRLYYEEWFGLPGRIVFTLLDAPAAAARFVHRLAGP